MQIQKTLFATCGVVLLGAATAAYAASLSAADQQFLKTAARTDMTEAHQGQMAETTANRSEVKDFAKTLEQDHTHDYSQLANLAAKSGITIPNGIDTGKIHTIQQLRHLKGENFDRAFVRDEVAAHRQALAEYKREAAHGQDPDLKAYASQMIPTLEKHLQEAEKCEKPAKHS